MLERYGHGGDLSTAEETFGRLQGGFLDFSSNMNPLGPPASALRAIASYGEEITRYPDPAVRKLRSRIAAKHDVPPESVLAGNGAAELIDLAARVLQPASAAIPAPSFIEYEEAAVKAGAEVRYIRLNSGDGFELGARAIASLLAEQARPDVWMIGSPNNPTGRTVDPAVIRALLDDGHQVMLDEAFVDFLPDGEARSLAQLAASHPRLIVLRSMTKYYAIPGIRLGYAIAHPDTIKAMRQLQVPWSVNSLAQRIGEAVLEEDEAFASRTAAWLSAERPYLAAGLLRLGFTVYPGEVNYVLASLPSAAGMTAAELQDRMGRRGILIRDASRFEGLDGAYVRFAVKQRADHDRLLAVLAECLHMYGRTRGEDGR